MTIDRTPIFLHYFVMAHSSSCPELLSVAIYENPAPYRWQSHARDHRNLWIVLDGEGTVRVGGRDDIPFRQGSVFVFSETTPLLATGKGNRRVVNFTTHFRGGLPGLVPPPDSEVLTRCFRRTAWLAPFCRELVEVFALSKPSVVSGLEFLGRALEVEQRLPPIGSVELRVQEQVEMIRRNPAAPYSVGELARRARFSVPQFVRHFRALTGETPNRFMINQRVARAKQLLSESDAPLESIAERLGYRDVYFFARQFKNVAGVSPGRFRRGGGPG